MSYPIDVVTVLDQIATYWAQPALAIAQSQIPVINALQNKPRPSGIYASVNLIAGPDGPQSNEEYFDASNDWTISGWKEIAVSVDYFGADAFSQMSALKESMDDSTVRDNLMNTYGLVIVSAGSVRNLSAIETAGIRTRAQCDFVFRVKSLATQSAVGYVEEVGMQNELDVSRTDGNVSVT